MTPLRRRRSLTAIALSCFFVFLAACSDGSKTGDESLLEFDQDQASKLGGTTTAPPTTAAADQATTTTAAAATATTQRTATTQAATQTTTTLPPEQAEVTIEVKINDQSPYFDPAVVQVLVGSKVRFTNVGTTTRSVLSDTGAFDSGPIRPGAVWIYEADRPGRYNYSDGGRPFAVGSMEVQS